MAERIEHGGGTTASIVQLGGITDGRPGRDGPADNRIELHHGQIENGADGIVTLSGHW
ncbi:hypothetical protein [Mycoplana rhizolycopersici]|uniref:Uncharacterized protein n=1 Tax=Mycoplana rhizolycopersici TaxID=2746702 RepID=A0ABX2QNK8_9HYPH|nr:hypothetical protein [Rhizobium rhizolycopersici]NVP58474.1 hypothetical protein [Rhizobium rhizolycopersici]